MTDSVELLAPARDLECGRTAIDCGADAVYIGAPRFGAREAAGNSLDDIAALVEHAHLYWARVYVTLNTLLRDDELPEAVRLAEQLYALGVDGLIIQDVGLLECDLPPLPLISSTQMHNATPERVASLEKVGFQRVILARELTLDQIREIRRQTRIELEYFVHGALCVSYSGQCYLSYALGGRSGNRGQCAQPCRKPYSLVDARGKTLVRRAHLLSLRDLNLSEHLRPLLEAGVRSLKIEGRLKDRAYVANVVAHYRALLDELLPAMGLRRSSSGMARPGFQPDVSKTFNRGGTTYFLYGRGEQIGAHDTPKMKGERLGKVTRVTPRGIYLEGNATASSGDGICFFDRRGELRGTRVHGSREGALLLASMEGIAPGTVVYRNHDHEFLTQVAKSRPQRRVAVWMTLERNAEGLSLTTVDEDGIRAQGTLACPLEPAQKPEQALATIRAQLARCGDSEFECAEVAVALDDVPFVPLSALNALRRDTLQQLARARAAARPILRGGIKRNEVAFPERTLSFEGNVLNRWAEAFYRRHGVTTIEPAAESGLDLRGRRVMTTRYCLKHELGLCARDGARVRQAEPLSLVDDDGRRLILRFDCARCEMEVYLPEAAPPS